jgi:hypothetical protein
LRRFQASSIPKSGHKDDRVEFAALLHDQVGLQKVIDRLIAVKGLLPEKPVAEPTESPLVIK